MLVLVPSDPSRPRSPDPDYRAEWDAACALGARVAVVDHEAITRGDPDAALRFLPAIGGDRRAIYRGWMMRAEAYAAFVEALSARGFEPITSASAYRTCHHLPEGYPFIEPMTAPSVWLDQAAAVPNGVPDWGAIAAVATGLGPGPAIVKDWVKSQKHAWTTACFIPDVTDAAAMVRVVSRFLELQGEQLVGGLVFRRYIRLRHRGVHPRSGMPLGAEVRTFWVNGRPIAVSDYWAEAPVGAAPDLSPFATVGASIPSPCFTMDLAQSDEGRWFILELGDGQVAGRPDGCPPESLLGPLLVG